MHPLRWRQAMPANRIVSSCQVCLRLLSKRIQLSAATKKQTVRASQRFQPSSNNLHTRTVTTHGPQTAGHGPRSKGRNGRQLEPCRLGASVDDCLLRRAGPLAPTPPLPPRRAHQPASLPLLSRQCCPGCRRRPPHTPSLLPPPSPPPLGRKRCWRRCGSGAQLRCARPAWKRAVTRP